jgi:hypothetical protein
LLLLLLAAALLLGVRMVRTGVSSSLILMTGSHSACCRCCCSCSWCVFPGNEPGHQWMLAGDIEDSVHVVLEAQVVFESSVLSEQRGSIEQ